LSKLAAHAVGIPSSAPSASSVGIFRMVRLTGAASTLCRTGTAGDRVNDQERSASDVFDLAPPHLAAARLAHQGSSRIASRREASAAACSALVGGVRR
jgi:hypothetical protein